jgi:prepilin-type N-terminal cleavage/methylation domain-containing protein
LKEDVSMNILKSNKGFTLIEMLLALALMGIVSVAMAAVLVTGIRIINNSAKVINNTNTAAGQIDNWYADNNLNSTASGSFGINFSNKGTYVYEEGQYITGKDAVSSAVVKAFEPDNTILEPSTEEIICKDTLAVNANLSASTYMQIYTKYTTVLPEKTVAAPSPSYLYTLTTPYPTGYNYTIFRSRNFRFPYTPVPVTANAAYVDYSGSNISFDASSEDKYYYVNNFVISQNGVITVTNNSTTGKKRCVFIYIKGLFQINSGRQLQVNITGTNSNYTSVFFVYSGNESIYLDGNIAAGNAASLGISCNVSGCFIYAPSSDVYLIATGITGVLAANLNINGNSTFFPVTASSTKPNWKNLVLKLIGS